MRMQVLPLTPVTVADVTRTPFILIIDQVSDDEAAVLIRDAGGHTMKDATGAAAVMVFTETVTTIPQMNIPFDIEQALVGLLHDPV